jgi:glucose dehydrogenase
LVVSRARVPDDPGVDRSQQRFLLISRGVAAWRDAARAAGEPCARRIFTGTRDAQLIALDAKTGVPCADFGTAGRVDLVPGAGELLFPAEYGVTSPPTVVGDRVIVGAAVADNVRIDAPSGVVRAFDARSGALLWKLGGGAARLDGRRRLELPNFGGPLIMESGPSSSAARWATRSAPSTSRAARSCGALRCRPARRTPMSYRVDGAPGGPRQFVVVAAGHWGFHLNGGFPLGDAIVAFALQRCSAAALTRKLRANSRPTEKAPTR